jgi:hypothetical protein
MRDHGTNARYVAGCRCSQCRAAATQQQRDYMRRRKEQGDYLMVDPAEAVAHVKRLHDHGYSYRAIGEQCGLDKGYVCRLARRKRILRETEDKILAVTLSFVPSQGLTPTPPVKRLVDEINNAGIRQRDVSRMLGHCPSGTLNFLRSPRMWATNARKIIVVYTLLARRGLVPASLLEDIT